MSTSLRLRLATLALCAAAPTASAACGDLYTDPIATAQATPPTAPTIARDASTIVARDDVQACPRDGIVEGASCNSLGVACEFGSSPDMHCNTTFACVPDQTFGPTWTARPSVLCPSYECPSGDAATIDGTACSVPTTEAGAPSESDELVCPMSDAICACTTGTDAAHAHARRWVCIKPSTTCPATRPLAGQSCIVERPCDYGACAFKRGMRMECSAGVWRSGTATCN
jgi:hypothetical protein